MSGRSTGGSPACCQGRNGQTGHLLRWQVSPSDSQHLDLDCVDMSALPPSSDFGETGWYDATRRVEESGDVSPDSKLRYWSEISQFDYFQPIY